MKISVRFLVLAGLFGIVIGIVYWFVAHEPAGRRCCS